ncbi:unnamed protein product [Malus baccata var. baccata]
MISLFQVLRQTSNSSVKFLSIVIVLFLFHNASAVAVKLLENKRILAVIVFGDSIVDPGNNNNIKTTVKANFPPYGRDFIEWMPTGRFSNGRVPSDFIAESAEVKKILPPYLDPNLSLQDLLTGVSFASGGSGYDHLSSQIVERTAIILSKSIYIVCTGTDDIANTYFTTPLRKPHYDIPAYTDLMIKSASSFLQELYGLGARRIGVLSLPAIGCVASQRTLRGRIHRECSEPQNQAAILFNSKLSTQIDSFNKKLPEVRLVCLDIYYTLLFLILNSAQYGFEVANRGCCGTGNIEVSLTCNPHTPGTCNDSLKYIFWDSYHPSEKTYAILKPLVLQVHKFF